MAAPVVVGVDDSPAAAAALSWAAGEARLRGAELVACTVVDSQRLRHPLHTLAGASGRSLAAAAGGYPVTVHRRVGEVADELVAAGVDADLLVVGSHGRGRLAALMLGSVSRACLAHAPCPVVVVGPHTEHATARGRVIVGVDGSAPSRQALLAAAGEATLRGATLDIVHVVHWDRVGTELLTPTVEELLEWGRKLVSAELAATRVEGKTVVVHGDVSELLVRYSADADLLVLGSRGRNPAVGLLLGSTSEHCARAARCPVMVTHATGEHQADGQAQAVGHDELMS
ncbi:universal stress protein [Amycolatopsis coloradensis]|uniref:Universal stress protein n=1 Tax=Amycolatopsis coloradensis TaxID=76021 RepID=A0ACD5BJ91_9PSEU